jgi:hypothetical protein
MISIPGQQNVQGAVYIEFGVNQASEAYDGYCSTFVLSCQKLFCASGATHCPDGFE